jgi:hypothetical protein
MWMSSDLTQRNLIKCGGFMRVSLNSGNPVIELLREPAIDESGQMN